MIFLMPEHTEPKKKSSDKYTLHELGVDPKQLTKTKPMNWKQRQKEEYSFYVTGITVAVCLVLVIYAIIDQIFFK
jgi:hypothetical protein